MVNRCGFEWIFNDGSQEEREYHFDQAPEEEVLLEVLPLGKHSQI